MPEHWDLKKTINIFNSFKEQEADEIMQNKLKQEKYLDRIRLIVFNVLRDRNCSIYLFGSRADGSYRAGSDVDIGIWAEKASDSLRLGMLREKLEESTIPYKVDVVDLRTTSVAFRENVFKNGLLWEEPH